MDGTPFGEVAGLYAIAAKLGIAPSLLDEQEIWQVAALLGLASAETMDRGSDGRNMLRARMAAAEAGSAPPSWEPDPVEEQRLLALAQAARR